MLTTGDENPRLRLIYFHVIDVLRICFVSHWKPVTSIPEINLGELENRLLNFLY